MESWIHSRLKEKQRSEQRERSEHEGGAGGGLTTWASNSSWGGGEPWEGRRRVAQACITVPLASGRDPGYGQREEVGVQFGAPGMK